MVSKIVLGDRLIELVMAILGLSFNENGEIYDNGVLLDWDSFESIDIEPIQWNEDSINEDSINGVLIFGDATIEFHLASECDALNWAYFDVNTITQVIKKLSEKLA